MIKHKKGVKGKKKVVDNDNSLVQQNVQLNNQDQVQTVPQQSQLNSQELNVHELNQQDSNQQQSQSMHFSHKMVYVFFLIGIIVIGGFVFLLNTGKSADVSGQAIAFNSQTGLYEQDGKEKSVVVLGCVGTKDLDDISVAKLQKITYQDKKTTKKVTVESKCDKKNEILTYNYCAGKNANKYTLVNSVLLDCRFGCKDGACLLFPETKPVPKPEVLQKLGLGAVCVNDNDCTSSYCDPKNKVCAVKPKLEVKQKLGLGTVCVKDDDCASNYCDPKNKVCADKPKPEVKQKLGLGAVCVIDDDCTSNYCDLKNKVCAGKLAVNCASQKDNLIEGTQSCKKKVGKWVVEQSYYNGNTLQNGNCVQSVKEIEKCAGECMDGACVISDAELKSNKFSFICKDTDPLQNIYLIGSLTLNKDSYSDICSKDVLTQHKCVIEDNQVVLKQEEYICKAGCAVDGRTCNDESQTVVAPTCSDNIKNGAEADIDCGLDSVCPNKCAIGKSCAIADECVSGYCDSTSLTCTNSPDETNSDQNDAAQSPATCVDGLQNGNEDDVDCGGSCPNACLNGNQNTCVDNEPEQNKSKKGELIFNGKSSFDICMQGKLYQYFCNANGYIDTKPEDCAVGQICQDGACVADVSQNPVDTKNDKSCEKDATGKDPYKAGTTTKFGVVYSDKCSADGKTLVEYSCTIDSMVKSIYSCSKGCTANACVQ